MLIQGDVRITGTAVHSVPDRKVLLMAEVGAVATCCCAELVPNQVRQMLLTLQSDCQAICRHTDTVIKGDSSFVWVVLCCQPGPEPLQHAPGVC